MCSFMQDVLYHLQACMYTAEQASQSGHRQSAMSGNGAIRQLRNRSLSLSPAPDARIHRQKQGMMLTLAYSVASIALDLLDSIATCSTA